MQKELLNLMQYIPSALCINNFASFKQIKSEFSFLGFNGFKEAEFEKKLPTGISTPNIDFYLENSTSIIGFESKFIEILDPKQPNHILLILTYKSFIQKS